MQAPTHIGALHADLADGVLIERALADDQRAFEVLVYRYRKPIFQAIYRILGDYHETYDVLQQVLLQLFLSLPTLATERPLKPWLLRVAHNRCVDYLRRRRPTLFSELESMDEKDEGMPLVALLDDHPLPEDALPHQNLPLQPVPAPPTAKDGSHVERVQTCSFSPQTPAPPLRCT